MRRTLLENSDMLDATRSRVRNSAYASSISTARRLVFLCLVIFAGCGQPERLDGLATPQVDILVRDISERYRRNYLFPALGERASQTLLSNLDRGEYKHLSYQSLAQRLTDDLQKVTSDVHSFVMFDSVRTPTRGSLVLPKNIDMPGVDRVERLAGNVGYIRVTLFSMPKRFAGAVDLAMSALADTDALIIDVRDTPGGHGQSVAYLCSYFFEPGKDVLLNTFEYRNRPRLEEWTLSIPMPYLHRPVFVLTSQKTASAAEGFAYQMQAFGRALIVGAKSRGGAHTGELVGLEYGYAVSIPTGQAINPVTKTNWERIGVKPDLLSEADQALETALKHFAATSQKPPEQSAAS